MTRCVDASKSSLVNVTSSYKEVNTDGQNCRMQYDLIRAHAPESPHNSCCDRSFKARHPESAGQAFLPGENSLRRLSRRSQRSCGRHQTYRLKLQRIVNDFFSCFRFIKRRDSSTARKKIGFSLVLLFPVPRAISRGEAVRIQRHLHLFDFSSENQSLILEI